MTDAYPFTNSNIHVFSIVSLFSQKKISIKNKHSQHSDFLLQIVISALLCSTKYAKLKSREQKENSTYRSSQFPSFILTDQGQIQPFKLLPRPQPIVDIGEVYNFVRTIQILGLNYIHMSPNWNQSGDAGSPTESSLNCTRITLIITCVVHQDRTPLEQGG